MSRSFVPFIVHREGLTGRVTIHLTPSCSAGFRKTQANPFRVDVHLQVAKLQAFSIPE